MRRYSIKLTFALFLATGGLIGQPSLYQQIQAFGNAQNTQLFAVNDNGIVVGSASSGPLGFGSAFAYANGAFAAVPCFTINSTATNANGVNNAGEVVGSAETNGAWVGFYWIAGECTELAFPGSTQTWAYGINNLGQIAGQYELPDSTLHGFLFINGTFTTIDAHFANVSVAATSPQAINDVGDIVGSYTDAFGITHGFYDVGGSFSAVDYPDATQGTMLFGINNNRQTVGYYGTATGHSFFLDNGTFSNIDPPNGDVWSSGQGINDAGEIVGYFDYEAKHYFGYIRTGLAFPLKGIKQREVLDPLPSPYTAPINAVFDHAMTHPYTPKQDGTITAFTNETGLQSAGTKPKTYCYAQSGGQPFFITGDYTGGNYLCYDNHPGYDFRAAEGTEVYATLGGTIYYPTAMVGISGSQAYDKYHVLELIPDSFPTLKIYHLHLSTHPACLSGTPPKGADCWPNQPVTVTNPAPGCPSVLPPPATDETGQPTHVNAGCLIAYVGKSGVEDFGGGPHLHFEVQEVVPENSTLNGYNLQCRPLYHRVGHSKRAAVVPESVGRRAHASACWTPDFSALQSA
jgi:murein DD-endopeptidase MepM/ murein hydrolase activator NlpD